jgi:hypothetical protein
MEKSKYLEIVEGLSCRVPEDPPPGGGGGDDPPPIRN